MVRSSFYGTVKRNPGEEDVSYVAVPEKLYDPRNL